MKALITGGGFVGQWMARALLARGDSVTVAAPGEEKHTPLLSAAERDALGWIPLDVRDAAAVERALALTRPDAIIHLAGISFPPDSDRAPEVAYDINALGAVRLLGAVQRRRASGIIDPVVLIVGSAVQYGRHTAMQMPLTESAEMRPLSIYGASKAAQETASLQFQREHGVRVVCTRSFNHSGVGQAANFLIPSLVERAKRIRAGGGSLAIGNDVVRDYLHVSDVVTAYLLLVERGVPGEVYNVASGRGVSTRQLAQDVLQRAGAAADISTEASLVRPSDIPVLIGSPAKLQRDTGWAPTKTHADIIDDLLNAATD